MLIGSGDWNDGMNNIGIKGKGESIWLSWFMADILRKMKPLCTYMNEEKKGLEFIETREEIMQNIEKNGWDGNWYKRAYFDDGTPLGSMMNQECKIDSISQSWSVISGSENKSRQETAMNSLYNYLVNKEMGIIKLLTPPFNESDIDPGYIKGYVPGIRENGGQYTHAAAWAVIAYTIMGKGEKAYELLDMINPVKHAENYMEYSRYKVEPYITAADIYAVYPNEGRGGWTWYTGSAGWVYRAGVEYILGFRKEGEMLVLDPCIPGKWERFNYSYIYMESIYKITVINPEGRNSGIKKILVDGKTISDNRINLVNDGETHTVEAEIG